MQETGPFRAFPDAPGSRHGIATHEVPAEPVRLDDLLAQLADQKAAFELAMARNAAIWEMVDEQLREAALGVQRARHSEASAVATADRATRRAADLEARIAGELETRQHLEQAIARAAREHQDAEARHASAIAAATARADELASALQGAYEESESRAAEIRRLAEREADLTSQLAQEVTSRTAIERQLHVTQAAIHEADVRATRERLAACQKAAEREAELDGQLRQEQEARSVLEADVELMQQAVAAAQEQASRAESERAVIGQELDDTKRRLEAAENEAAQVPRLRERIQLAHRMEAVGRLASEAAATCGSLLADVHQNVQQWLVTSNGDSEGRQRGESVLDDVTRVAGLLRQLAGYADEHGRASAPADLGSIIRDLEPVLRRVAGQDVEVRLPEAVPPLCLDLSSERVERLLVNLASYGRERMPDGGRMRIDLATVVVDREFTARHPNVRAGAHALITMTKSRPNDDDEVRNGAGPRPRARSGRTPGLELGTLQSLVGECGGHLWMTVDPQGDIVSKLHLPLPGGSSEVQ